MGTPKFPITQAQFKAWFVGKHDRLGSDLPRVLTCPIARCLKSRGIDAWVYFGSWKDIKTGYECVMPKWAVRAVAKFDERKGK